MAPKLALGIAAEMAKDWRQAIRYYDIVSRTDPAFTSASFGLARCLAETGDRAGAADAFCRVPSTSDLYAQAQMAMARILLRVQPAAPGESELVQACKALQALTVEGLLLHRLSADLLLCAVEQVEAQRIRQVPAISYWGANCRCRRCAWARSANCAPAPISPKHAPKRSNSWIKPTTLSSGRAR